MLMANPITGHTENKCFSYAEFSLESSVENASEICVLKLGVFGMAPLSTKSQAHTAACYKSFSCFGAISHRKF